MRRRKFERERDILDVWFDSGSSHEGVLGDHPELGWPYTVYLEGSDQYRGGSTARCWSGWAPATRRRTNR